MNTQPAKIIYFMNRLPIIKYISGLLFYLHNGIKIHLFLRNLNQNQKIDFIEYSEGGDFWNALTKSFKYASHLHGSNYTFKSQSDKKPDFIDWVRRKVEHVFINRADKVISPCRAMVELVEKEMGSKINNAHIIPYPIPDNDIEPILDQNGQKKVNLLFACRNDPIKGGDIFIKVLELLPKPIQLKINVEFYGYIAERDLSHLSFLKINKFVPKEILNRAYQKTHICVIPSLFDNSPNTVYEAMAYGKIVVASSVGGIPEIIGNNQNGFLFDPLDINDFKLNLENAINAVANGGSYSIRINAQRRILSVSDLKVNARTRLALMTP